MWSLFGRSYRHDCLDKLYCGNFVAFNCQLTERPAMTEREREELVVNYMPLANKIAWAKRKTTPICITIDELKSAAYMGLVEAASRFDPARGVAFGVFARMRIAGQITDYLRTFKWSSK